MAAETMDADNSPSREQITGMFETFRDKLDEHHDRRERIIKVSRDITALSKKIIFALQRTKHINKPLPAPAESTVAAHLAAINKLLVSVAPDLAGINRYRYASQMRGLEELVEALTLVRYLSSQTLLTPQEATAYLPEGMLLTTHDYLNGVMDLFGEMMRFATVLATRDDNAFKSTGDQRTILQDMHILSSSVEMLPSIAGSSWQDKAKAMRASVAKVEKLGYGIAIRGREHPDGWMPDEDGGGGGGE